MKRAGWIVLAALLLRPCAAPAAADGKWCASWASSQQITEPHNLPPPPGLSHHSLRQVVQLSLGGQRLRVTFSNVFGDGPVAIEAGRLALDHGASAIDPVSSSSLSFNGHPGVQLPAGASATTDPLDFNAPPLSRLAVSLHLGSVPSQLSGHPGSRTTSYIAAPKLFDAPSLPSFVPIQHWYFLSRIDVQARPQAAAIAILGDSLTDGRGSTTDQQDRWPDQLARRLQAAPQTAHLAVLNLGLGGNRVLHDGLGPSALSRLERDAFTPPGVRFLVVFEGINDLGTASASAAGLIAAYAQIVRKARARGLKVIGATLMPCEGHDYFKPALEKARQKVNAWIRKPGNFDALLDFDAITRDPGHPARLRAEVDGGDHLHPSAQGYKAMAEAVDLGFFRSKSD